ncbi:MAG: hypothetical protein IT432_13150 [Phycisphaerales bacterium]|nr:hypothetical protein [Phycisphaerales bacterium]
MSDKICVVCKQDVSNKPRRKDPAGKYICEDCAKKTAAAKPAVPKPGSPTPKTSAPAKSPAGDGLSDDFWNSKMQPAGGAAACPGCGTMMPGGSKLCTRCGFDLVTGKPHRTQFSVEKEKKNRSS